MARSKWPEVNGMKTTTLRTRVLCSILCKGFFFFIFIASFYFHAYSKTSKTPQRIVSMAPSITELLFAVGAGRQIIAVTNACNYPEKVKKLTRIGDVTVDYERLLLLHPDMVVIEKDLNTQSLNKLISLNIPVLALKNKNFQDLFYSIKLLGETTGHLKEAKEEAARIKSELNKIKVNSVKMKIKPLVYLELWDHPLMTAGPGTFLDDAIITAGGKNLGHVLPVGFSEISSEYVVKENPDIIVIANIDTNIENVKKRPGWSSIKAVKTGKVFVINPDILVRPGPRLVTGLKQLFIWFHGNY